MAGHKGNQVATIGRALHEQGHVLTSFDELGLTQFADLAREVQEAVDANAQLQVERAATRVGMVMCKDHRSKRAGAELMRPVVEVLFADNPTAQASWDPYTVNQYETGHFFSPHQDYLDGTVIIGTVSGARNLDIYRKEPEDDVFDEVITNYKLVAGSVLLLDGYRDLGHAIQCLEGPSISVVGDVRAPMTIM